MLTFITADLVVEEKVTLFKEVHYYQKEKAKTWQPKPCSYYLLLINLSANN